MKGLYQEMVKNKGKSVQNYIIAARIAQGYDEAFNISQHQKDEIVSRWNYIKIGIKKKRNPGAEQMDSLHSLVQEKRKRRHERWERVHTHFNKKHDAHSPVPLDASRSSSHSDLPLTPSETHDADPHEPEIRSTVPSWRQQESDRVSALRRQHSSTLSPSSTADSQQSNIALEAQLIAEEEAEQLELERAITVSVAEASRGNPEEDKLIASAIRASIAELERAPVGSSAQQEEETLKRAMQASLEEAGRKDCTEEEQKIMEETLRKSLLETSRRRQHGSDSEWDTEEDDENEELQRILTESKELAELHAAQSQESVGTTARRQQESGIINAMNEAMGGHTSPQPQPQSSKPEQQSSKLDKQPSKPETEQDDEDAELRKAIEESERAEIERIATLERQKTEEDIVMEYVRKQSLLEEEHRQRLLQGRDTVGEGSGVGAGQKK